MHNTIIIPKNQENPPEKFFLKRNKIKILQATFIQRAKNSFQLPLIFALTTCNNLNLLGNSHHMCFPTSRAHLRLQSGVEEFPYHVEVLPNLFRSGYDKKNVRKIFKVKSLTFWNLI